MAVAGSGRQAVVAGRQRRSLIAGSSGPSVDADEPDVERREHIA
jgi:hypothetical protein